MTKVRLPFIACIIGMSLLFAGCNKDDVKTRTEDLKLHYSFTELPEDNIIKDESGNGFDGTIFNRENMFDDYESGSVFMASGAYVEMPAEVFKGEDTLSISVWLKNYSGSVNTSAMFIGTKERNPINYWLFNPSNPSGMLKSVITDGDNKSAPYKTEVGFSPSTAKNGIEGPLMNMGWNHYVTIITPTELTVYLNGEDVGTVAHTKKMCDLCLRVFCLCSPLGVL